MSKLTRQEVINRVYSICFLTGFDFKVEWHSGSCWLKDDRNNTIVVGTTREIYDSLYAIQEFLFILKDRGMLNEKES